MAIDSFSLDDTDDGEVYKLEIQFIENDVIMFSVIDKTTNSHHEVSVISVVYSDLVEGIAKLRRPTKRAADVLPQCEKCGSSFLWLNNVAICGNPECGNRR